MANRQDEDKTVDIILKSLPDAVEISVHDQGPGFNPEEVPDPTAQENILKSLRTRHLFHAQFYGRSRLVYKTRRGDNGAHAQATLIRNCIKEISEMAELNINERQAGDVTVLDMSGKITIGEGSVALRTAIRRLLEEGKKRILLNLAGVGYIDSSGIRRAGFQLHRYRQRRRSAQTSQSHTKTSGSTDDHETPDSL
jgi:anti-anti-sigma factor